MIKVLLPETKNSAFHKVTGVERELNWKFHYHSLLMPVTVPCGESCTVVVLCSNDFFMIMIAECLLLF